MQSGAVPPTPADALPEQPSAYSLEIERETGMQSVKALGYAFKAPVKMPTSHVRVPAWV